MNGKVKVYKNRTNVLGVDLGMDVSSDTFESEIRTEPSVNAPLILTWTVDFVTDGTDGLLTLTVDDADTDAINVESGYMDLKRTTGGEPVPLFDVPLEVQFIGAVTP